jgi:hypothetical protein
MMRRRGGKGRRSREGDENPRQGGEEEQSRENQRMRNNR